jgi:hypothetical protein
LPTLDPGEGSLDRASIDKACLDRSWALTKS